MSIEFLKQIKYLDVLVKVRNIKKDCYALVYIEPYDDGFEIRLDSDYTRIDNYNDYELAEVLDDANLEKVLCEKCEKNEATLIKNCYVLCETCVKIQDIEEITLNVYKFKSNEELKVICFSHKIEHEYLTDKDLEKGLAVIDYDTDYDHYSVKLIDAKLIGEF